MDQLPTWWYLVLAILNGGTYLALALSLHLSQPHLAIAYTLWGSGNLALFIGEFLRRGA